MRKYIKIFENEKLTDADEKIFIDILETTDMLIKEDSFDISALDWRDGDYRNKKEGDVQLITPFGEVPFYHSEDEFHHGEGGSGCRVSVYYRNSDDDYEIQIDGYSKTCSEDEGDLELDDLVKFYKLKSILP